MDITSIFKEILTESAESIKEPFLGRLVDVPNISGKAQILIGIRRSGKTTILRQIYSKISPENFIHINFSDERIAKLEAKYLGKITEAFAQIKEKKLNELGDIYWFLDEIQVIDNWEDFINRIISNKQNHVFITGSSAKLLSSEIATVMRGRSLSQEVFPLSFKELILWNGFTIKNNYASDERALIEQIFSKYLYQGSFPELEQIELKYRTRVLQEYYNTIFFRDIVERYNPSNPNLIKSILNLLMHQISNLITINKTYEKLKALGYKLTKDTINDALSWFNDCYLLFQVPLFCNSIHRQNTNPKKLYCIDNGLINAVASGFSENKGFLLENLIFLELRRNFKNIYYYKDRNGYEVDFVVKEKDNADTYLLFQCCHSLENEDTKNREIRALVSAMTELNTNISYIITINDEETIKENGFTIQIIPAWKWCLGMP